MIGFRSWRRRRRLSPEDEALSARRQARAAGWMLDSQIKADTSPFPRTREGRQLRVRGEITGSGLRVDVRVKESPA